MRASCPRSCEHRASRKDRGQPARNGRRPRRDFEADRRWPTLDGCNILCWTDWSLNDDRSSSKRSRSSISCLATRSFVRSGRPRPLPDSRGSHRLDQGQPRNRQPRRRHHRRASRRRRHDFTHDRVQLHLRRPRPWSRHDRLSDCSVTVDQAFAVFESVLKVKGFSLVLGPGQHLQGHSDSRRQGIEHRHDQGQSSHRRNRDRFVTRLVPLQLHRRQCDHPDHQATNLQGRLARRL